MASRLSKNAFLKDLRGHIHQHCAIVEAAFQPLSNTHLNWRGDSKQWSIGQCFDHLNLTHAYYRSRIDPVLRTPAPARDPDEYQPSFWAGIYMRFAFNPRFSFPAPSAVTPASELNAGVIQTYLQNQRDLLDILDAVQSLDLNDLPIPIKTGVSFNLGDALRIVVYHDALHLRQADGVLKQLQGV